jgi:hypothetical protein
LVSRASIGGSDLSVTLKDLIEEMTAMQTALESRWLNSPSQFKEWLTLQETIQETREVLVVETIQDHLYAISIGRGRQPPENRLQKITNASFNPCFPKPMILSLENLWMTEFKRHKDEPSSAFTMGRTRSSTTSRNLITWSQARDHNTHLYILFLMVVW